MKWFEKLKSKAALLIALPFAADLMLALADGKIDAAEFANLTSKARLGELVVLALVLILLKARSK